MIKAVIFDLDGTIANTLPMCVEAFHRAVAPLVGRALTDKEIMAHFGASEEGIINRILPEDYERGMAGYLKHYRELHDMSPAPFDGMVEILRWLKSRGIVVALVTGKGAASCDITLDYFAIRGYFDMVETGSPHGVVKTECIERVLERFSLAPSEAIYVGDAVSDVSSSHKAGIAIVGAAWAPTTDVDELRAANPDELFTTVTDFDTYLQQIIA